MIPQTSTNRSLQAKTLNSYGRLRVARGQALDSSRLPVSFVEGSPKTSPHDVEKLLRNVDSFTLTLAIFRSTKDPRRSSNTIIHKSFRVLLPCPSMRFRIRRTCI